MPGQLLKMEKISKTFPGVKALDNVDLNLNKGEVLGIVGENGAGKSTLMNILGGIYQPSSGKMYLNGKESTFSDVLDSQRKGVAFIHQELALEPHLSVAENIFLGREQKNGLFVSKKKMQQEAKKYLDFMGLNIDPSGNVLYLSTGQQQMVEIAKALSLDAKILIMDEPTSSLSENEVKKLFKTVSFLKKHQVAIIYISHKMSEIFEITDRVMVMRDGCSIGVKVTKETNTDELIYMMVGRELKNYYVRTFNKLGEVALQVKNMSRGTLVQNTSFSVRKGEILGFYGLIGAGRSELMQAVVGFDPHDKGEVLIDGHEIERLDPIYCQKKGIVLVPENRRTEGLFLNNTVGFNLTITVLNEFINKLHVDKKKENSIIQKSIQNLRIRTPSDNQIVHNLSGGNQQKIVLAKWLATSPKVLILDEPTKGIDVGAKREIYAIMNQLAKEGIAIVMVSSELNEVINMCDRLIVMREGKITGMLNHDEFAQEKILKYAIGG
jgi:ribose transport system ATP-binding protein/inositol transport system ATP-binding protein